MEGFFEKIGIDSGIVIIAILVAMLVLILIVLVLVARVRDITNKYTNFMRGEDGKSLERSVERRFQEVGTVVRSQAALSSRMQFMEAIQNRSLSRYGIVKYDAFDDVGGKLSFALAMLDHNDTGFVLNAIHSKENCYLYLKEVVKGESYIMLSHEEVEALRAAKKFGSEEETILKYQLDKAVRAEKKSANRLQEMNRPRRRKPSSKPASRSTGNASGEGMSRNTQSTHAGATPASQNSNAGTAGAVVSSVGSAAAYSANAASSYNKEAYDSGTTSTPSSAPYISQPGYISSEQTNQSIYRAAESTPQSGNDSAAYAAQTGYDTSGYAAQTGYDASSYTAQSGYDASSYTAQPGYDASGYAAQSGYDAAAYGSQPAYDASGYAAQSDYDTASYTSPTGNNDAGYAAQTTYDTTAYAANPSAGYEVPTYTQSSLSGYDADSVSQLNDGTESGTAYEVPQTTEHTFVNTEEINDAGVTEESSSVKTSGKAGNRKTGQPPKKTKRNKNRKNNERKEQGHAGH